MTMQHKTLWEIRHEAKAIYAEASDPTIEKLCEFIDNLAQAIETLIGNSIDVR